MSVSVCAAAAVENALYALIEADPSSRRLMIRNVPYTATEVSLRQTVEAYGPIEDFKLVIDRNTGTRQYFNLVYALMANRCSSK